ncbi:hypothetical protein LGT39_11325 [Demequina sp. TTPB684]|uniref:hypothetical protein n=1 Tax=unclassified Demequina TaxID=2620311 RepID=UPI001CF5341B|nr:MULTISPECIES: hypothetical protein [unclassified Demequina]MCB2413435.1 hypothetical protein [Demequina sp. TTPB684]UPU87998.1 hypothetical protein LGT36_012215 [Demequina sp. TMPB413]
MLSSVRVLAPEDSEEVGTRVADFLETAGWTALIVSIAVLVLTLIVGVAIAKKAGYSGWWGALAVLVPGLGFILFLLFGMLKWPALKERDEAIGVIEANDLMLPSRERAAIKEAERRKQIEEEARRRMDQARLDREKAEAESARYRRVQADKNATAAVTPGAATAGPLAAAPATPAQKQLADPPAPKPGDGPAAPPPAKGTEGAADAPAAKPADGAADASANKPADADSRKPRSTATKKPAAKAPPGQGPTEDK